MCKDFTRQLRQAADAPADLFVGNVVIQTVHLTDSPLPLQDKRVKVRIAGALRLLRLGGRFRLRLLVLRRFFLFRHGLFILGLPDFHGNAAADQGKNGRRNKMPELIQRKTQTVHDPCNRHRINRHDRRLLLPLCQAASPPSPTLTYLLYLSRLYLSRNIISSCGNSQNVKRQRY